MAPLFFGGLIRRLGTRRCVVVGAVLFGAGLMTTGWISGGVWQLYLFYGVLSGLGTGFVYPAMMGYVVRHGLRPRHGGLRLRSHSLGAGGSGPDPQRESAGDVLYSGWCLSGADPAGQYPAGGAPAGPAGGPVSCLR